MIGQADAIIARPGFYDQDIVAISPPEMSWRTDGPGSFECEVDNRALTAYGLAVAGTTNGVKGRWLWWEHPTAGAWGGVITRTDVGSWTTRITAEQFNVLLRKRRMSSTYGQISASPGSLALLFLTGSDRGGESLGLTSWTAEETGPALDLEPRGGDLCDDVMNELAGYGYQWRVKADTMTERAFQFRKRLGNDKSRNVLLSEGGDIPHGGFRMSADLWTVANTIVGVGGDASWKKSVGYQLDNDASIRALGRRYGEVITYNGVATRSTIAPLVKRDLEIRAYPKDIAEVQVVDQDYVWTTFREGDTVAVASSSANVYAPYEIDIRSLSMSSGLMTLAGRVRSDKAF